MKDDDRINSTMEEAGVGYDTVLRQELKKLAREIRGDENAECERIAVENESRKTVEGIRQRRKEEH